MGSHLIDWMCGFTWDQLTFRGHWLLPLLLVITVLCIWIWNRTTVGSRP